MFDKNFYPTPKTIIEKMIGGRDLRGKTILEPSAGKGDILEYIENRYKYDQYDKPKMYCIEKDEELQHILRDKGFRLLDSDFLKHRADISYDYIFMNPPFDNGYQHLLKAWDIIHNGEIICLLNEETIKNPYSKGRQLLLNIIKEHGQTESLGNCFSFEAERKTDVNVVMITLTKKQSKENPFDFNLNDTEKIEFNEQFFSNEIARIDVLQNICDQYQRIKNDFADMLKSKNRINKYVANITGTDYGIQSDYGLKKVNKEEFDNFINDLKAEIWRNIAKKTNIEKYMTDSTSRNFTKYLLERKDLAITKENIQKFVSIIFQNRFNILENGIGDVFDTFTKYYKENRCHVEGWKTNDRFKVNKKIILPNWIKYGDYYNQEHLKKYGDYFKTQYDRKYGDIDKVLCFISGESYDNVRTIAGALKNKFDILGKITTGDKFDNTCESTFFNIKFFKKGTIHLEFKDEWLWSEFNMRACAGKNWLPEAEVRAWKQEIKDLVLA